MRRSLGCLSWLFCAHTWWLVAALLLLPSPAAAGEPTVEVRVRCPALEQAPEARAELEARALVELSVRRQSSGLLLVSCDSHAATLSWTSAGEQVTAHVRLEADPKLFVDSLVSALWNLTAPERRATPPAPPAPRPAVQPSRPLRLALDVGGRVELWPRAPNALPGVSLGLSLLGSTWAASASAQLARALDDVEGLRSSMLGGAASFDVQPALLRPLSFGAVVSAWRFNVKAPPGLTPDESSTWTLSTALRLRFFRQWQGFTVALGPELLLYPVRPRVLIAERAALIGPHVAGGFGLELGWLVLR